MTCPDCGSSEDRVLETRDRGDRIWRRRECTDCGFRWSTDERRVLSADEQREAEASQG